MAEPLIMFVCTANICRSPWAELRGQQALPGFRVRSGGILRQTVGQPMDETMAATLPPEVSADAHRAQLISRELATKAALILTMEQQHRLWLVDEYPSAIRKVFQIGQFVAAVRHAPTDLGFDELLRWAYLNRGPASTEHDVKDPYRQGPEKAAQTAAELDQLITELAGILTASLGR
ncbi:MAG: hypothetical protein Q4G35_05045 [Propionibacteriaceae bacterium]|nr:hypothetical protein [Propionibacteriaceae bacterium]